MWMLLLGCNGSAKEAVEDSGGAGDSGDVDSGRDSGDVGEGDTGDTGAGCVEVRDVEGIRLEDPSSIGGELLGVSTTTQGGEPMLAVGSPSYGVLAHLIAMPTSSATSLDELLVADFPSHESSEPYTPRDIDGDGILDGVAFLIDWEYEFDYWSYSLDYRGELRFAAINGPVLDEPGATMNVDLGHVELLDTLGGPWQTAQGGEFDAEPGMDLLVTVTDWWGAAPGYAWLIDPHGTTGPRAVDPGSPSTVVAAGDLDGDGTIDIVTTYQGDGYTCVLGVALGPMGDSIPSVAQADSTLYTDSCGLTGAEIALGDVTKDGLDDIGFDAGDIHFIAGPVPYGNAEDVAFLTLTGSSDECLIHEYISGDIGDDGTADLVGTFMCTDVADPEYEDYRQQPAVYFGYPAGVATECDADVMFTSPNNSGILKPTGQAIMPTGEVWLWEYDGTTRGYWLTEF